MTTQAHHSHTRLLRRGSIVLAALVLAATLVSPRATTASANTGGSYTWPLKPFNQQHAVRGFFGDPRIGNHGKSRNFHFGIDIQGRNHEVVYANISGTVLIPARQNEVVFIVADGGRTRFEFWHVKPYVHDGQHVVGNQTALGHIYCWEHVHFSEWRDGRYVNPLRRGALGPYRDHTRPYVKNLGVRDDAGRPLGTILHGRVKLTVEAYDPAPTPLPEPYTGNPVAPVKLKWRLVGTRGAATPWRTTFDFGATIPPNSMFPTVYGMATRQNWQQIEGRYVYILADRLDTTRIPNGAYELVATASDTKGNTGTTRFPLVIANL
jgi:hypothetical protein